MNQIWNAKNYIDNASFVAEYGLPVLKLLKPKSGEEILDLGCGDGSLTVNIEELGANVYGVDSSPSMIEKAQERGLSAEVISGDCLRFNDEFDAVFSNAILHWMTDVDFVISWGSDSLKTEGRFVGEFGGKGNIALFGKCDEKCF